MKTLVVTIILLLLTVLLAISTFSNSYIQNSGMSSLTAYLLAPSADSSDERLNTAFYAFEDLAARSDQGRFVELKERASSLIERNRSSEYSAYQIGRSLLTDAQNASQFSNQDSAEDATQIYQKAIAIGTEQVQLEARLLLADFLRAQSNPEGYEMEMGLASQIEIPHWERTENAATTELRGGFVDPIDIQLQKPVNVVLVWEPVPETQTMLAPRFESHPSISIDGYHLYSWENRLYQVGALDNLIASGGFEGALLPYDGGVTQLPLSLYGDGLIDSNRTALISDPLDDAQNLVLEIRSAGTGISGLSSNSFPLVDDSCTGYLVTGRYRSSLESSPLIGVRWLLEGAESWDDNSSTYVITEPSGDWTRFAALLQPPEDAEALQYWALNRASEGFLQIDDIGLFPVTYIHGLLQ